MRAETNKQIVLDAITALNAGNPAGYFDCMTDDVQWTFFGSHRLARTFHGKDDIMNNFVPQLRERLDGLVKLQVKNVIAEDDQVVVEAQGEGRAKDGREYNNHYCIVYRLEKGKVTKVREYMDTELTKAIFG